MDKIELVKQVTKRPRKTVVVMNLERDLKTELHKLDRLSKRATIFLSYARQDQKIAERTRRARLMPEQLPVRDGLFARLAHGT